MRSVLTREAVVDVTGLVWLTDPAHEGRLPLVSRLANADAIASLLSQVRIGQTEIATAPIG